MGPWIIAIAALLISFPAIAQAPGTTGSQQLSLSPEMLLSKIYAVPAICALIIVGGLLVFCSRWNKKRDNWSEISIQTLGTIFSFRR
jgi:hypothetical protein